MAWQFSDFVSGAFDQLGLLTLCLLAGLSFLQYIRCQNTEIDRFDIIMLSTFLFALLRAALDEASQSSTFQPYFIKIVGTTKDEYGTEHMNTVMASRFVAFVSLVIAILAGWSSKYSDKLIEFLFFFFTFLALWVVISGNVDWKSPIVVAVIVVCLVLAYKRDAVLLWLRILERTLVSSIVMVYSIFILASKKDLSVLVEDIWSYDTCTDDRMCIARFAAAISAILFRLLYISIARCRAPATGIAHEAESNESITARIHDQVSTEMKKEEKRKKRARARSQKIPDSPVSSDDEALPGSALKLGPRSDDSAPDKH